MVATPDLGSGAERRGGSSPFIRTSDCHLAVAFFVRIKRLSQSVAVWQTCLRRVVLVRDSHCCYATTKINYPIASQTSLAVIV